MNLDKVRAAVAAARKELQVLLIATAQDPKSIKALAHIARVDNSLVKADEKLSDAEKAVAPKVKKEKAKK